MKIEKCISLAKPFAAKCNTRPVLTTALITDKHVIATNSHMLIRLKHSEGVRDSRLHNYKNEDVEIDASSYPDTNRLFLTFQAQSEISIYVDDWLIATQCALVAAKEQVKFLDKLNSKINARKEVPRLLIDQSKIHVPALLGMPEQIEYSYQLENDTGIQVALNALYLETALKTLKRMKIKFASLYYFGPFRPIKIQADGVEILILPIRYHFKNEKSTQSTAME